MARPATARQREIFDQLLTLFLTEGFAHFTIDRAASDLHCSKSTLYALAGTSDELQRRILVSFFREVTRRTDHALDSFRSPSRALAAYFDAMSTALEPTSPQFWRDVVATPVGQEVYAVNTRGALAKIRGVVHDGIRAGEFREMSGTFVAQVMEASLEGIQTGRVGTQDPAGAYRQLGKLILEGLATR